MRDYMIKRVHRNIEVVHCEVEVVHSNSDIVYCNVPSKVIKCLCDILCVSMVLNVVLMLILSGFNQKEHIYIKC